jgi:hypothetical protein
VVGTAFVVLGQALAPADSRQRAFHDPPPREHLESALACGPPDDLHRDAQILPDEDNQLPGVISAIEGILIRALSSTSRSPSRSWTPAAVTSTTCTCARSADWAARSQIWSLAELVCSGFRRPAKSRIRQRRAVLGGHEAVSRSQRALCQLKHSLGLDHFEGRTWLSWHHHVTLVSAVHLFITLQRLAPDPKATGSV